MRASVRDFFVFAESFCDQRRQREPGTQDTGTEAESRPPEASSRMPNPDAASE
jgi:hypothetical protein